VEFVADANPHEVAAKYCQNDDEGNDDGSTCRSDLLRQMSGLLRSVDDATHFGVSTGTDSLVVDSLVYAAIGLQDRKLNSDIFLHRRRGTFLEVMSFSDTLDRSVSKFFEERLAWRGVCVVHSASPVSGLMFDGGPGGGTGGRAGSTGSGSACAKVQQHRGCSVLCGLESDGLASKGSTYNSLYATLLAKRLHSIDLLAVSAASIEMGDIWALLQAVLAPDDLLVNVIAFHSGIPAAHVGQLRQYLSQFGYKYQVRQYQELRAEEPDLGAVFVHKSPRFSWDWPGH
jgi:hypothetical protein